MEVQFGEKCGRRQKIINFLIYFPKSAKKKFDFMINLTHVNKYLKFLICLEWIPFHG